MIGLIDWVRSFTYDANGAIIKNANGPVFAAHPQPNLWLLLQENAANLAKTFDFIQFPPGSNGGGEGYSAYELRNLSSNWGTESDWSKAIAACYQAGMMVAPDLPFRQMSGAKVAGVYTYASGVGNMQPSNFQYFGQPGEVKPPFVAKDDVIDPTGNYAFGTVVSYQNCVPKGYTISDRIAVLAYMVSQLGLIPKYTFPRWDDLKGMNAAACLEMMNSQPDMQFLAEVDTGNQGELAWVISDVMKGRTAVEDYAQYWNTQRACNGYDATQFDKNGGGVWNVYPDKSGVFSNNPDVATTWSATGGISQQTAFNLLLSYAYGMCLPAKCFLVYAEDYWPASPDYPTGRGYKNFIDNMSWFARKFAYGAFRRCWVDKDVYAYTRDGNGGSIGQSTGCLVALNFNTYDIRTITVQTVWPEGTWVHNYSYTGNDENYTVGAGGMLTLSLKANYFSNGQSYYLIAPGGISGPIPMRPLVED